MQRTMMIAVGVLALATVSLQGQDTGKVLGKGRDEWVEILKKDKNIKLRRVALLVLEAEFSSGRGVQAAIIEALQKDDSSEIRKQAAQVLGKMAGDAKAAVLPLGEAMTKDKAAEVREAAARALGGPMKEFAKPALPMLVEALKDSDPSARAAVAATLKELGTETRLALPQIIDAIKDKDSNRFTQVHLIVLVSKFEDESRKTIPVLIEMVTRVNADTAVREAAIDALGRIGAVTAPVQSALEQVLKETKAPASLRGSACVALTKIGGNARTLWPTVKALTSDSDKDLRVQAIRLAGKLGRDEFEVVTVLIARTADDNQDARLAAIQELGALGTLAKDAEGTLDNLSRNDSRKPIRIAATAALKRVRGEVEKD